MAKNKIEASGSAAAAPVARTQGGISLSAGSLEKRLADARARREKVLAARGAAGEADTDRPPVPSVGFPKGAVGFAVPPPRLQEAAGDDDPEQNRQTRSGHIGGVSLRRLAIGATGAAVLASAMLAAAPVIAPLADAVFGRSGLPDPTVKLDGLAGFDPATGDLPPSASNNRGDARIATSAQPTLQAAPDPARAPDLSRPDGAEELSRSVASFPPPLSTETSQPQVDAPARSTIKLVLPKSAAIRPPGPPEMEGMAALVIPGLTIDDPGFPGPPRAGDRPEIPGAGDGPARVAATPAPLSRSVPDRTAGDGAEAPARPAIRAPYGPAVPAIVADDPGLQPLPTPRPDRAASFPVRKPEFAPHPGLTFGRSFGRGDPGRLAARLPPSLSVPSMPLRGEAGAAALPPLATAAVPRLWAVGPVLLPADPVADRVILPVATAMSPNPTPPAKLSAPEAEHRAVSLGEPALAEASRFRLSLTTPTEAAAVAVHNRLIAAGFTSIEVSISPSAASPTVVTYFHDGDARTAAQLAERLGGRTRAETGITAPPPVGTLDIRSGG